MKGYNVWVEAEDFHTELWWEELVQAGWDGRVMKGRATAMAGSEYPQRS